MRLAERRWITIWSSFLTVDRWVYTQLKTKSQYLEMSPQSTTIVQHAKYIGIMLRRLLWRWNRNEWTYSSIQCEPLWNHTRNISRKLWIGIILFELIRFGSQLFFAQTLPFYWISDYTLGKECCCIAILQWKWCCFPQLSFLWAIPFRTSRSL